MLLVEFQGRLTQKLEGIHFVVKLIEADFYIDYVSRDHPKKLKNCSVLGWKKSVEQQYGDNRLGLFQAFS